MTTRPNARVQITRDAPPPRTLSAVAPAAAAGTPDRTAAASSTALPPVRPPAPTYAEGETKTFKLTRQGLAPTEADIGGEEEEGADESVGGSNSGHGSHGPRVLSSRERSYIAYQQRLAAKATTKAEKVKYRDRARERQQNLANPDYADGAEEQAAAAAAAASLSIEASKFLGGDVAHTHLVKGLDYALLARTREELARKDAEAAVAAAAAAAAQSTPAAAMRSTAVPTPTAPSTLSATPTKAPIAATAAPPPSIDGVHFLSHSAAAIHQLATSAPALTDRITDRFLPGRMTYHFPLVPAKPPAGQSLLQHAQHTAFALPTTVRTSYADLPQAQQAWAEENVRTVLPDALWSKVVNIFTSQHAPEAERQQAKKPPSDQAAPIQAAASTGSTTSTDLAAAPTNTAAPMIIDTTGSRPKIEKAELASAAGMDLDYDVPRPPPAANADSDDDDIFAGAGSDYKARIEPDADEPMYDVPRPPPDDAAEDDSYDVPRPPPDSDEEGASTYDVPRPPTAAAAAAGPVTSTRQLFNPANEPAVRQLDPTAQGEDSQDEEDEEDDIFAPSIDELDGSSSRPRAPETAEQKRARLNKIYADIEYEDLYAGGGGGYSGFLDDDEDEDDDGKKKKPGEEGGDGGKKGRGKRGRASQVDDAAKREAAFNAEYAQVSSMLKARGVKLGEFAERDARRRQTKPAQGSDAPPSAEEDARALKRQKILLRDRR